MIMWQSAPFMEKAKPFTCRVVIILQVLTLRARRLGKSREGAQRWPVPPADINYSQRSQGWLQKHKPVAAVHLCELQEQAACTHNRRYLQTSRAWRLVRDFKDKPTAFPKSSRDIKLAGPEEKPDCLRLQSDRVTPARPCVFTPGSGHRNGTSREVSSRQDGKMCLPEADTNGE